MLRAVGHSGKTDSGGAFSPIWRERVLRRLQNAAQQRITVMVAPAGYGKSVALRQFLETSPLPYVHFEVAKEHATLLGFARGLADAFAEHAPDARASLSIAYDKNRSSKTAGTNLAAWLHAHIKDFDGLVVIDDLQRIESDPRTREFLVALIELTKPRTRWLLSSRATVALPIASWMAYSELDLLIDEHDLAFSDEEMRAAARAYRVGMNDEELQSLRSMAEGWPTAIGFALRSSTRSLDAGSVTASTREMVYAYLAEQVYVSLTQYERELLHVCAYLDEIDIGVLETAGFPKARAIIDDLRSRVSFITPTRRDAFHCHDLFREFLKRQVELKGDDRVKSVALRAAKALESSTDYVAALRLYIEARAWVDVQRMLRVQGRDLFERGHADVIQEALANEAVQGFENDPLILGLRARSAASAGRLDKAENLYRRAIANESDPETQCVFAIQIALLYVNQMRKEDAGDIVQPYLYTSISVDKRAEILGLLAYVRSDAGRIAEGLAYIEEAESLLQFIDDDKTTVKVLHRSGLAMARAGAPMDRALDVQTRAASLAVEHGMFALASHAYGAVCHIVGRYKQDDVASQAWYAQQAAHAARKAGDQLGLQTALLQLLNLEMRKGNESRVRALDQELTPLVTSDVGRTQYLLPPRALVLAWNGQFSEARRVLTVARNSKRFYDFDKAHNAALMAIFAAAEGQGDEAVSALQESAEWVEKIDDSDRLAHREKQIAILLGAAAAAFLGKYSRAARLVRSVDEKGDVVVEALRSAVLTIERAITEPERRAATIEALDTLDSLGYGGIAKMLLVALDKTIVLRERNASGLTPAQLAILEALAQGDSAKEIASRTGRSTHTVRAHIQNILTRLQCHAAEDAVAIARRQGAIR